MSFFDTVKVTLIVSILDGFSFVVEFFSLGQSNNQFGMAFIAEEDP